MEEKRSRRDKAIMNKKNTMGNKMIPNFKSKHKAIEIKYSSLLIPKQLHRSMR